MEQPERKVEPKAADSRPVDDGRAYYMVGPFGRVGRGLLWCGLSTLIVTGVGCLWALWSAASTLKAIEIVLRTKGR